MGHAYTRNVDVFLCIGAEWGPIFYIIAAIYPTYKFLCYVILWQVARMFRE